LLIGSVKKAPPVPISQKIPVHFSVSESKEVSNNLTSL